MLKAKDGKKGVGEGKSRGRRRRKGAMSATAGSVSPNLWEIVGRFDQALSLVVVAHRSLAAKESAEVGDEEEALRQGIRLLKNVRQELDRRGISFVGRAVRVRNAPLPASLRTARTSMSVRSAHAPHSALARHGESKT